MQQRTAMTIGVSLLAALSTAAMAQPGGGGRPGGGGGGRQGGDPSMFLDRMMEMDANGDGKLSRDEVPEQFGARLFEGDANADGFLTREELQTAMETLRQRGPRGVDGERPGFQPGQGPGGALDGRQPGAPGAVGAAVALGFDQGMQQAGRAMRQLRRSAFDDASRAADLRAVQTIQSGLIAAKGGVGQVPMAPQAAEHYGEDLVKYHSDFRLGLIQAIMESLALEAAVIEGDSAGAKESLEHLLEAQKLGHDAFQPEEEAEGEAAEDAIPEPARVRPGNESSAPARPARPGRPGGDD